MSLSIQPLMISIIENRALLLTCFLSLSSVCLFHSVQNIQPSAALDFSELDSAMQQQERIMNVSYALASEASRKSKLVAG